jgi:hypothetical protein
LSRTMGEEQDRQKELALMERQTEALEAIADCMVTEKVPVEDETMRTRLRRYLHGRKQRELYKQDRSHTGERFEP